MRATPRLIAALTAGIKRDAAEFGALRIKRGIPLRRGTHARGRPVGTCPPRRSERSPMLVDDGSASHRRSCRSRSVHGARIKNKGERRSTIPRHHAASRLRIRIGSTPICSPSYGVSLQATRRRSSRMARATTLLLRRSAPVGFALLAPALTIAPVLSVGETRSEGRSRSDTRRRPRRGKLCRYTDIRRDALSATLCDCPPSGRNPRSLASRPWPHASQFCCGSAPRKPRSASAGGW